MDFHDDAPHWHVTSDAVLAELWSSLMGEGGFGRRSLWLLFLDEDSVTLPVIMPVDDIEARPDAQFLDGLFQIVGGLQQDGAVASFAALLTRPGPVTKTDDDRAWAAELTRTAQARGVSMWPVHLATYEHIQQLAADDLIGA